MSEALNVWRTAGALSIAGLLALGGYRKRSLSPSGAVAAFLTGAVHFLAGPRLAYTLIAFFISSSALTKFQSGKKKELEHNHKEGGCRNWVQVLANSLFASVLCALLLVCTDSLEKVIDLKAQPLESAILVAFIGHYACCNGDTWASEIGILSKKKPYLVLNLRPVPHGTNGGISVLGLTASAAGGLFIGLCFWLFGALLGVHSRRENLLVIAIGCVGGFLGSLIDSLLGATVQYSGWCSKERKVVETPGPTVTRISGLNILDNHQVNFLSSLFTAALCYLLALYLS
mmetsp:Transcript_3887/g.9523  ORF Transcript_3887/g.9523 Transcript_3887/m.9523 type:complete len:287 (+) Transcript_3887:429-1289(+)|eukprot:CAMPEP_0177642672 /NCGR_PEP_ID=MMETSP0447-20121125/7722_1 /TAXON_ID=0 /ORGANISM="Stygamoeba regulata, Strain BSH-02190019" /LENGTH=286 /DNA_ID=CAMNT_0019144867 /DNA_START=676 /DNA_END=1536 /DNA_ORIENTATION=+